MKQIGSFYSMAQVRTNNRENGYHWFEPETLRWFGGRVSNTLYGGCVFVSSEQDRTPFRGVQPRRWSVRVAMADGSIQSYCFGGYRTRQDAHSEAKWLGQALKNGTMVWCNDKYEFVNAHGIVPFATE